MSATVNLYQIIKVWTHYFSNKVKCSETLVKLDEKINQTAAVVSY